MVAWSGVRAGLRPTRAQPSTVSLAALPPGGNGDKHFASIPVESARGGDIQGLREDLSRRQGAVQDEGTDKESHGVLSHIGAL